MQTPPEYDAAVEPAFDAAPVETPDAAIDPDATPAIPARWYEYDDGPRTWSSVPALDLFGGIGAPSPGEVRAAWSHCYGGIETLCFGTATGWTCTDDAGASFFGDDWSSIDAAIAADPPTHIARFQDGFGGSDDDEVLFSSNEKWWLYRYANRPIDLLGGIWVVSPITDHTVLGGYDSLWFGDPNAPPNPDLVTASFTGFEVNRRWKLWDTAGNEYSFRRNTEEWEIVEGSKLFELENSPPPALVVGATRCMDRLYVLTRSSN